MENKENKQQTFKYNMALYYQSAIIYFLVFVLYVVVRGQLIGGSFSLIMDPIIYFFVLILIIVFISIAYNLFLNRKLIIDDTSIMLVNRRKNRAYLVKDIVKINVSKEKTFMYSNPFQLIRIRFKNKRAPLIIRPQDYENQNELVSMFRELKAKVEK